jgi:holo-[acyl-carrier protein] synthase
MSASAEGGIVTDRDGLLAQGAGDLLLGDAFHMGVDQVELEEFSRILATGGDEFLATVYTECERDHCAGRIERLAARFAAKEAASKALGTGLRGIGPREIEIVSEANGRPRLSLHGRAHDRAQALGIQSASVSLTHTRTAVVAFVVALAPSANTVDSSVPLSKESRL